MNTENAEKKKKQTVESPQVPAATVAGQAQNQQSMNLDDMYQQIMNREDFSFDVNEEAMYRQYADQYARGGELAMMDTMGQAQAMTGGYGNSYAQSVGQQTYQNYMQGMNDVIPDLYQMALDRYLMEGDRMMQQYQLMADREAMAADQRRYDQQWEAEQKRMEEEQRRYDQEWEENMRRYNQEWAAAHPELVGGGTGSSGGSGGSGSGNNWLNRDGTVNVDMVNKSSKWWQDYAAKHGLDPNTGKYLNDPGNGNQGGPSSVAANGLSAEAKAWMATMPYVPSGGNSEAWKSYVLDKLANSSLSEKDKEAIAYEFGF